MNKGIETLERAKELAQVYCSEGDVDPIKIWDESTGEVVTTGHATLVMEWTSS